MKRCSYCFVIDPKEGDECNNSPYGLHKPYHLPGEHDQDRHAGDVVYRGGKTQETSASWPKGVFVSSSQKAAAQWGDVSEYEVVKRPKLLDLGNWNATGAKAIVGALTGQRPGNMSFSDYDQAAGELFIQMPDAFIARLKRAGWDGAKLGEDMFLIGKLSDYYKPRKR